MQDDDDTLLPHMVATMMAAARATGADVVTSFSDNVMDLDGRRVFVHRSLAVGNAFAHNFFVNNYGKANLCTRTTSALKMGGHGTGAQTNSPYVDWALFTRASLHGLRIELVPYALYEYLQNSKASIFYTRTGDSDRYDGHGKMLRDAESFVPRPFWDVLAYCRYHLGLPKVGSLGQY